MELFEYYDFYSLFLSFSSLNARFDSLLTRCHAAIDLDRIAPNAFIRFLAQIVPQINNDNIQSLHSINIHQMSILAHDDYPYFIFLIFDRFDCVIFHQRSSLLWPNVFISIDSSVSHLIKINLNFILVRTFQNIFWIQIDTAGLEYTTTHFVIFLTEQLYYHHWNMFE